MQQNQQNQKKDSSSGLEKYAKYSGIGFQMITIILIFVWAGKKIDEKYFSGNSVFIIIFSLLGVGISLYLALKDLINFTGKK